MTWYLSRLDVIVLSMFFWFHPVHLERGVSTMTKVCYL